MPSSIHPTDIGVDVLLTGEDGHTLELMLAERFANDSDGNPVAIGKMWKIDEVPTPVNLRVTEDGAGLADRPPEMEAVVFRDTYTDGMKRALITNTEEDYFSGDVNTSVKYKAILPPGVTVAALPTSEGKVRCMAEWNGFMYLSDGRYLHRSSNGTTWSQVHDVGASNVISDIKLYGDSAGTSGLVLCAEVEATEVALDYYYSTNGTTWTQVTTDATRRYNYLVGKNDALFGLQNPNTFRSTTLPFTAAPIWGSATTVGDKAHNFQGGTVVSDVLLLFKTDEVFTIDGAGLVKELITQFAAIPSANNFDQHVQGFNANVYTVVDEEIWEYDPLVGSLRDLGLKALPDTLISPTATYRRGIAFDGAATYAIHRTSLPAGYDESVGTSIVRITFDKDNNPVIERWMSTTDAGVRPVGPLSVTRLFTGLTTGTHLVMGLATAGTIGLMALPVAADPTLDTTSIYSLAPCRLRTGWMVHNFPGQIKDYTSVNVDLRGVTPVPPRTYVNVYYYLDNDISTRYTLGTQLTSSKLHTLEFSSGASGRTIMIEFELVTSLNTITPQIFSWAVRAAVKFPLREVISLGVRLADGQRSRRRGSSAQTAEDIRAKIRHLRNHTNQTLRYQDYRGYDFPNVRILPGMSESDNEDIRSARDSTLLMIRILNVSEQSVAGFVVGEDVVDGDKVVVP